MTAGFATRVGKTRFWFLAGLAGFGGECTLRKRNRYLVGLGWGLGAMRDRMRMRMRDAALLVKREPARVE